MRLYYWETQDEELLTIVMRIFRDVFDKDDCQSLVREFMNEMGLFFLLSSPFLKSRRW